MYSNNYNQNATDRVNIGGVFTPYLSPDEIIEWCGQPSLKGKHSRHNLVLGVFYSGFALFWSIMVAQSSLIMSFFALPFFLAGLYIIFGHNGKKLRQNTYYAVTNERCIIICNDKQMSFCDYRYTSMTGVNCVDGSVFLSPFIDPHSYYINTSRKGKRSYSSDSVNRAVKTNFLDINENAVKVCQLITMHIDECH